ncbi:hypothetical protein CBS101457_002271 [Exobasidium rhododendri]|nr:hypothetical protein CBS101457_002271 [Exobasidium rhododendri]
MEGQGAAQASLASYKIDISAHIQKKEDPGLQEDDLTKCLASDEDGFFYIPNFISEQEEEYLREKIKASPKPKWRELQARRLQYWGGQVSEKQVLIPETMPDFLSTFPPLIERLRGIGAFEGSRHGEPNHCLVNEYQPGQGIMPHEDGGAYFEAVATVSLGGYTLLDIYRYASSQEKDGTPQHDGAKSREQDPRFSILQEPRSLLITRGAAYRAFLHGIAERSEDDASVLRAVINKDAITQVPLKKALEDSHVEGGASLTRETRISLTFRDVEKVASKALMKVLGKR